MDLSDACKRFLEYCEIEKKLSPHTISAYRGDLEQFERQVVIQRQLINFTETWIENAIHLWRCDPDLKASTVKRSVACIKVFVRWLFQRKLIASNFLERIHLSIKLPKRLPRNLQTNEIRKLVAVNPENIAA